MPNCVHKTAPPPVGITATRKLLKIPASPIPTTTSRPCSPGARKPDIGSRKPEAGFPLLYNQPGPTIRPSCFILRAAPIRAGSAQSDPLQPKHISGAQRHQEAHAAPCATKHPSARQDASPRKAPVVRPGKPSPRDSETMEQLPGLATATPNIAPRAALMADMPGGVTAASFALGPLQLSFACFPLRLPVLANRSPLTHHESAPPSIPRSRVPSLTTKH
jgi:hypothetical protein